MTYAEHTRALPTLRRKARKKIPALVAAPRETLNRKCCWCGLGHSSGVCALREERGVS